MAAGLRRLRAWAQQVLGWVLLVVGIILFPLPGPGLVVMLAGMLILAQQYEWAERRLDQLREKAFESAHSGVRTHPRAVLSLLTCALLAASGLLWVWAPPQPSWWTLPTWTWLPGGLWAGVSQAVSGLVTLGLVVWAYAQRLTRSGMLRP